MKKILVMFTALLLMLAMSTTAFAATEYLVLTTGGATGAYYMFGGEIASMLSNTVDGVDITTQTSGGSKDNVRALFAEEAEIAIMQNDVMSYAYQGTDDFGGQSIEGFSAIGALFPEHVHIVVAKDSGIKSVSDLKGCNVGIGAVGSGAYFNVIHVLEMAGMTLKDIKVQYLSFAESAESFANRQIDAFFVTGPYSHAAIVDASLKREISLISFSEEEMAKLKDNYEFYVDGVIPAGSYEGVDVDTVCPAVTAVMVVDDDLSEELVYNLTKSLFENKDQLTNAKKEYLSVETAVEGIPTKLSDAANGVEGGSFHPGALKYYREIGVLD